MNQFEYLIPFIGIIYALSATDLLVSTHRIITERHQIKLHLVPIIWAMNAFLLIINGWWGFLQINDKIVLANAGQLFLLSLLPLMVFLIAALSLPHSIKSTTNMWQYFENNKRPFYLCHIAYLLIIPVVLGSFADEINMQQVWRNVVIAAIFASLLWFKHWLWHFVIGGVFLLSIVLSIFQQTMTS